MRIILRAEQSPDIGNDLFYGTLPVGIMRYRYRLGFLKQCALLEEIKESSDEQATISIKDLGISKPDAFKDRSK